MLLTALTWEDFRVDLDPGTLGLLSPLDYLDDNRRYTLLPSTLSSFLVKLDGGMENVHTNKYNW